MLTVSIFPPHPMQLDNISRPTPPDVGSSGPVGYGLVSQPPTSAWVQPQQTNIGKQYYSGP